LWGHFQEKGTRAAGKNVCLALYDKPLKNDEADGSAYLFGNNPLFFRFKQEYRGLCESSLYLDSD
jgi:hypothetical protein